MTIEAKREAIKEQLAERLVDVFIATRTPAPRGTPDWLSVRRSLECELFARAIPAIISNSAILALVEPQVSEDTVRSCDHELRIGDKVEVIGDYAGDFRGVDTWVAGIRVHDTGEGLDITLSEQWPILNRHWSGYRGQTDGFRPEELRLLTAAPASEPQEPSEERAREVLIDALPKHEAEYIRQRESDYVFYLESREAIRAMIRFAKDVTSPFNPPA